jgi:hypothetical protein
VLRRMGARVTVAVSKAQRSAQYLTIIDVSVYWAGLPPSESRERVGV